MKRFGDWWKEMKIVENEIIWNIFTTLFIHFGKMMKPNLSLLKCIFTDWWNGLDNVETKLQTGKKVIDKRCKKHEFPTEIHGK